MPPIFFNLHSKLVKMPLDVDKKRVCFLSWIKQISANRKYNFKDGLEKTFKFFTTGLLKKYRKNIKNLGDWAAWPASNLIKFCIIPCLYKAFNKKILILFKETLIFSFCKTDAVLIASNKDIWLLFIN